MMRELWIDQQKALSGVMVKARNEDIGLEESKIGLLSNECVVQVANTECVRQWAAISVFLPSLRIVLGFGISFRVNGRVFKT